MNVLGSMILRRRRGVRLALLASAFLSKRLRRLDTLPMRLFPSPVKIGELIFKRREPLSYVLCEEALLQYQ